MCSSDLSTNIDLGGAVTLDGSASSASTGRTLAGYSWSVVSGNASLVDASAATATLTPTSTGTVVVSLTVTDNLGGTNTAEASVTVLAANATPTAVISSTSTAVATGASLVFDAGSSTIQTGRPIASYAWTITSGSDVATISGSTNSVSVTLTGVSKGSAVLQLTVTDDHGKTSTASTTVTVSSATAQAVSNLTGSSSGGGGGAADAVDLALLAAFLAFALALRRRCAG